MAKPLIGIGLYSVAEAARILHVDPKQMRRWLFGYRHGPGGERAQPPVSSPDPVLKELDSLSFADLLEIRLINGFREAGISLQSIRRAVIEAQRVLEDPHPFVFKRIETDGKSIFATAARENDDTELLDLLKRQYVFDKVIRQSLLFGVDFDSNGKAARWFPVPQSKAIVLDPARSFGKPILTDHGVPTEVLYDAFMAEGENASRVARVYQVPPDAVSRAVKFERALRTN